jgi:hypothetical protein
MGCVERLGIPASSLPFAQHRTQLPDALQTGEVT